MNDEKIKIIVPGDIFTYVSTKENLLNLFKYIKGLEKENKELKTTNEKAIEHIKSHQLCYITQYEEESCFDNHLLDILEGNKNGK